MVYWKTPDMDFAIGYGLWKAVENWFSQSWASLKAPMVTDDFNFWFCEIKKVGPSLKYNNSISVSDMFFKWVIHKVYRNKKVYFQMWGIVDQMLIFYQLFLKMSSILSGNEQNWSKYLCALYCIWPLFSLHLLWMTP